MNTMKTFLFCTLYMLITSGDSLADDTLVQSPSGPIRGIATNDIATGQKLYQFRGIRYAKAPIRNLRFRKPEPVDKWNEEYDATSFGIACAQNALPLLRDGSENNSEDCLFLNIYVPWSVSSSQKRSVMVWIHGGGFTMGNGHVYDGTRLAVDGDVIVVTINYRLGIFGFLSLYHPAAKGNYGLWDQFVALKWVHENIASFGGDPDSVTIFGESAGGMSVSFQSAQPLNKGLFQRVIAQSGTLSRYMIMSKTTTENLRTSLSERTNCTQTNQYEFVECLRELSKETLLATTNTWQDMPHDVLTFEMQYGPCVDGEFFPEHPYVMLKYQNSPQSTFYKSLDFMTGTTSQEGSLILMMTMPQVQDYFKFNMSVNVPFEFVCSGILKPFVKRNFEGDVEVLDKMCQFYRTDVSVDAQSNRAADCVADIIFTIGAAEMLEMHSSLNGGKTYQYQFSKNSPSTLIPAPEWFKGSAHGDEILFLFHNEFSEDGGPLSTAMSDTEKYISKWMIAMWTSFAKTGIPSAGKGTLPWLQYDHQKRMYLDVNDELSLRQNLHLETVKFWTEQLPPLGNNDMFKYEHDEL